MLLACAHPQPRGEAHEPVSPTKAPTQPIVDASRPAIVEPPALAEEPSDIRPVESPPPDDPVVRARQHFARGAQAFEAGDHSRAMTEFVAADQLVPHPALRFNIARCRSAMGDLHGARMELQALLARADVEPAMRRQVTEALAAIERKLVPGG